MVPIAVCNEANSDCRVGAMDVDEKMKPWAWVFWVGYAQGLVGHSREDGKKMKKW